MKQFADIEQSKLLADILPHDSADRTKLINVRHGHKLIPGWSLAALFNILTSNCSKQTINITRGGWIGNNNEIFSNDWFITYEDSEDNHFELHSDELIDAVIDMIVKLKEQKLL